MSPRATRQARAALALPAVPAYADCDAAMLGTHRTLVLPREGAAYGRAQHGPLAPGELVLTFDDGPRPETTSPLLQALKAECTRATFFMNGEPMLRHPALARQVQDDGHTVAMHGFRHDNFAGLSPEQLRADLRDMQQAHRSVVGGEAPAWRFPFLSEAPALLEVLRLLKEDGWRVVHLQWSGH